MGYCSKDDILLELSETELRELTDDEGAGVIDEARVSAAISRADALIDSYCGRVASVPFSDVPTIIKQHSVTLAIYFLYSRRSAVPEVRAKNYEAAVLSLRDIASGKAALPPTSQNEFDDSVQFEKKKDERLTLDLENY